MHRQLLAACLLLTPISAIADDISFTYLELDYINFDLDGAGGREDGLGLSGSLGISDHFYLFADYFQTDLSLNSIDINGDQIDLGLGFHLGLGDLVQGLVEASYTNAELGPFDADGYTINVGVRVGLTESIELGGKLGYSDLDGNIDGGYGRFNLLYKISDRFGVNFIADIAEDSNAYGIGLRASF